MSGKLTSPKQDSSSNNSGSQYHPHDNSFGARRQMTSHLPPFNMPPAPRTFSPTPGFDSKQEPQQQHGVPQKYPPGSASSMNAASSAITSPPPGQGQGEYGSGGGGAQGAPSGYMNTSMNYWPTSVPGNPQGSGPVPFPHHQNPSHLPSVYGNIAQQQGSYPYPPRPNTGSQRAGSPHNDSSSNAPLPPPSQGHDSFQSGGQQPGGNYPMYMPQQYGQPGQQGPGGMYGPPSGGYGGYPAQPYNNGPGGSQGGYPGMYSNQMPHSREGSQDNPNWNRSPYGQTPSYGGLNQGGYGSNQFAPAPGNGGNGGNGQQVAYNAGRAGRGASHTGERPFKCDQCPQSFQRSHDLKRHKRIHLAIKPFPCPSCDKSFSRKDALKRHILVKGCGSNPTN